MNRPALTACLLTSLACCLHAAEPAPEPGAEPTSKTNARLRQALKKHPQADANKDGVLTRTEGLAYRKKVIAERAKSQGGRAKRKPSGIDTSLGGGEAPIPKRGKFRVFILSGQSNMVGQGQANELPEPLRKPHGRIRIWVDGKWQHLVPTRRFGPEVSFAQELARAWPEDCVGIIKVAIGGTGILAFVPDWKKEQADRTSDGHKGPIYKTIIGCFQAAKGAGEFELMGFVWKQGGKDMRNAGTAKEYLANFRKLIAGLRKDTGVADLPAFISTYRSKEELAKALQDPQIRALTLARSRSRPGLVDVLKAHTEAPDKIPHVVAVAHGKLPMRPDGIHFNTEGQLKHGKLLAEAVLKYEEGRAKAKAKP